MATFPNIKDDNNDCDDVDFKQTTSTYALCRYILLQEQTIVNAIQQNIKLKELLHKRKKVK